MKWKIKDRISQAKYQICHVNMAVWWCHRGKVENSIVVINIKLNKMRNKMINGFSIVVFRTKKYNDNFRNVFIDRYRDSLINSLLFAQSASLRNDWTISSTDGLTRSLDPVHLANFIVDSRSSYFYTWLLTYLLKFIKPSSQDFVAFCCENTYHLLPESEVITMKSQTEALMNWPSWSRSEISL